MKTPLISRQDLFEHRHLCRRCFRGGCRRCEKNGRGVTPWDLVLPWAYLSTGPFFTLLWGWENAQVHTAAAAKNWFATRTIPLVADPPYSPDHVPMDFFLFPKVKEHMSGLLLTLESLKKTWEGVSRSITAEDFAAAFRHWFEWGEKCVRIGGREKLRNKVCSKTLIYCFINTFRVDFPHT